MVSLGNSEDKAVSVVLNFAVCSRDTEDSQTGENCSSQFFPPLESCFVE